MAERERKRVHADPSGKDPNAREERLRALFAAAYPATQPPPQPSEALRRRVAAVTASAPAAGPTSVDRRTLGIPEWRRQRRFGFALAGAASLLVIGLVAALACRHFPSEKPSPLSTVVEASKPLDRTTPRSVAGAMQERSGPSRRTVAGAPRAHRRPLLRTVRRRNGTPPESAVPATPTRVGPNDDLRFLNEAPRPDMGLAAAFSRDEWERIEQRVRRTIQTRDDFVTIPFPRIVSRADGLVAAAVADYRQEAAVVDTRLSREVTLAVKGAALSDLCEQLRKHTGVRLEAGRSVADEKVTVFCDKMPLRDVMRQLGRPFGYTWLRSSTNDERPTTNASAPSIHARLADARSHYPAPSTEYRYELVQDLRSQLVEEDLRNRDRNAALLAADREMERYRPYLHLSPEEALAKAKTAPPGEKWLLEQLAGRSWGPIQAYFRLSREDLAALRAGQRLTFRHDPRPGEQPLPEAFARDVLKSVQRDRKIGIIIDGDQIRTTTDPGVREARPVTEIPQARAFVELPLDQRDLGRLFVQGNEGFAISIGEHRSSWANGGNLTASVVAPAVGNPQNAVANARLAKDPALRKSVTIAGVRHETPKSEGAKDAAVGSLALSLSRSLALTLPTADAAEKVTSADVLEALHAASGLPIVADYYTRLYPATAFAVPGQPLFAALNRIADTLRQRWAKEGEWLQFRSTSYYDDRLKEVPNRLLARWAASRREHGALTLDDLIEIAQLTEVQLNARDMAQGARVLWLLEEWDLARYGSLQPYLRFLATLTPSQRLVAQYAVGLPFVQMTLAQQQQFIAFAAGSRPETIKSLDELAGATLHVAYTLPGGFEWRAPGKSSAYASFSPARGPTREAALQAALRADARAEAAQIAPTELAVSFRFTLGTPQTGRFTRAIRVDPQGMSSTTDREPAVPQGTPPE